MKSLLASLLILFIVSAAAQKPVSTSRAHAHNDYEQAFPFWMAWKSGFGSIEADIFLVQDQLIVAHDAAQLRQKRSLDSLYLQPLLQCIRENKGHVYAEADRNLQLMIDIKTKAVPTLETLIKLLSGYPEIIHCPGLKIVISGNRPDPKDYPAYPSWIYFDGGFQVDYSPATWDKIAMLSDNFARYSSWNGKGRIPEKEKDTLLALVRYAHAHDKKIRFWNSPDILNSWYAFLDLGIDYINTDDIPGISQFFKTKSDREFIGTNPYTPYAPTGKPDGVNKRVKNIILIIGDGTSMPQWYAGYTANRGHLNVFGIKNTGWSKTSSSDNYITDSAPGATAISSGKKTNNRAVGVDPRGNSLNLITDSLKKKGLKTGIITTGDVRDATPASFYAHQSERSDYTRILNDLSESTLDLIAGNAQWKKTDSIDKKLNQRFVIYNEIPKSEERNNKPVLITDTLASRSILTGRGNWLSDAFSYATHFLNNKTGFFLMLEGAQVDYGGHANKLSYVVSEVLDLDQLIGKAIQFADQDGETLVIVTGDHETGGLTLTAGDYERGYIGGQFATTDHTALPVPVFAYGPRSYLFTGIYENTAIFYKMLESMK